MLIRADFEFDVLDRVNFNFSNLFEYITITLNLDMGDFRSKESFQLSGDAKSM